MADLPIFAADTVVPVDRSRAAIEQLLTTYHCRKFISGIDRDAGKAMIQFELRDRLIRFEVRWPKTVADLDANDPWRKRWSSRRQNLTAFLEQIERQRWRALHLVLKAKLESINSGVATFDEEFLPYMVLPNQQTVAQTHGAPGRRSLRLRPDAQASARTSTRSSRGALQWLDSSTPASATSSTASASSR